MKKIKKTRLMDDDDSDDGTREDGKINLNHSRILIIKVSDLRDKIIKNLDENFDSLVF